MMTGMKRIYQWLTVFLVIWTIMSCSENNIGYDEVTNVPEGIYVAGDASEFSVEIANGMLESLDGQSLYSINTWLKPNGNFYISYVGEDGQPKRVGVASTASSASEPIKTYVLKEGGEGVSVAEEGLYRLILNTEKNELTVLPYHFRIRGKMAMTEGGDREVALPNMTYDKNQHIVTWTTGADNRQILPSEFTFAYTDSEEPVAIKTTEGNTFELPSYYTGTAGNVKMNTLAAEFADLTSESTVNLNLRRKGNYQVTLKYDVLAKKFAANILGDELIEPEPTGYPQQLFMAGEELGGFNSPGMIRMAPVGALGNGSFWAMGYFTQGKGVQWSANANGTDSFSTLGNNVNFTVDGQGKATVNRSGYYVVYIDMHRKLIAFEEPELYGIGTCFDGVEAPIKLSDGMFKATTSSEGSLQMYASSLYNNRDWNTMEFNILNGKIVYRGVGELPTVPVAAQVPIELDLKTQTAEMVLPTGVKHLPTSATNLYLIADNIGDGNWGSDGVATMWNTWGNKQTFIYLHHFKAGMKLSVSTSKVFGKNEFVALTNNKGYEVVKSKAVVPHDGVYMVYVDMSTRDFHLLDATVYAYGAAANDASNKHLTPFVLNDDKKTMSLTLPADGRLRLDPVNTIMTASGAWKRELYFAPEGGDIKMRLVGEPEPNQKHVWKAGTRITLDFETMKATVE